MTRMRCHLTLALAQTILVVASSRAAAGTKEIEVAVRTVEPDLIHGRLVAFSLADGAVVRAEGDPRRIATRDIVRITSVAAETEESSPPTYEVDRGRDEWTLALKGDDWLVGRVTESRKDAVVIETADLGRVAVPLDSIVRVTSAAAQTPAFRGSVSWLDRSRATDDDRILLTNGDVVRGFITAVGGDGFAIDSASGDTRVPLRLVVAARFAHVAPPPLSGPYLLLSLRHSGRVTATALDWLDDGVEARLRDGTHVRLDGECVVSVDVVGGRWEWLSGHHPVSSENVSMLSLDWERAVDRNVLGAPINVSGRAFDRGLGVHSRCNLAYELAGRYREFVTSFGMDDDSGPWADVDVLVLVDGQRRFEKAHVRPGTLHGPIRLDVSKTDRLELIVDYGENGDLQDRFDWVEPGLIR